MAFVSWSSRRHQGGTGRTLRCSCFLCPLGASRCSSPRPWLITPETALTTDSRETASTDSSIPPVIHSTYSPLAAQQVVHERSSLCILHPISIPVCHSSLPAVPRVGRVSASVMRRLLLPRSPSVHMGLLLPYPAADAPSPSWRLSGPTHNHLTLRYQLRPALHGRSDTHVLRLQCP